MTTADAQRIQTLAFNAIGSMVCNDFDPDDGNIIEQVAEYLGSTPKELFDLGLLEESEYESTLQKDEV